MKTAKDDRFSSVKNKKVKEDEKNKMKISPMAKSSHDSLNKINKTSIFHDLSKKETNGLL